MKMMSRLTMLVAIAGVGGCVSLDKHRQLEMSHMKLQAEKSEMEQELFDARGVADNLRNKVVSLEGELSTKEQLVANLASENDRLESAFGSAQKTLESMADKDMIQPAVITQTILPEALDSALKRFAAQYPSAIEYDAHRGTVKWKSDLLFALGSDVVRDSAKDTLKGFAEVMAVPEAENFDVIVVGHTDNVRVSRETTRKLHPTNWHLSAHRAIAVSDALQAEGVTTAHLGVMGFGEFRPIASNDSEDGRAQNRRVEIHLVPVGSFGSMTQVTAKTVHDASLASTDE
ncbi:MAG: flagellar motor protein MotB [Phycisphaerae bacterium]